MSCCDLPAEQKQIEEENSLDKAAWNKCMFASFLSISTGIIVGTVATVALSSDVPILVGAGMGVSMAAAYCGKKIRSKDECADESATKTERLQDDDCECDDDDDDDDDMCHCFDDDQESDG